jgi:hypothetical protein
MDEQPAQESVAVLKRRKVLEEKRTVFSAFCLLVAFPCGWLLALLLDRLGHVSLFGAVASVVIFVSPVWLGIITALPVDRRNKHLFLTLGIGLLAWIGWSAYWISVAIQQGALFDAYCAQMVAEGGHGYCHVGGGLTVAITQIVLLIGSVPLLLCSMITFLIRTRKERRRSASADKLSTDAGKRE